MRLIFTSDDYCFGGRPRPGFPLILSDSMEPAEPFQSFLHHDLLRRGKLYDLKTWEAIGRRLWDYAKFLYENGRAWNEPPHEGGLDIVPTYRDWSVSHLSLEPPTINGRLRVVVRFYEWALKRGLVAWLPFEYEELRSFQREHMLMHAVDLTETTQRPDVLLDEWETDPAFLTTEQMRVVGQVQTPASWRILCDLMRRAGLRSCEARTFPLKYVFNPRIRPYLNQGQMIEVELHPSDMEIKFKKKRVVHIPYSLMEDMFAYTRLERNRLKKANSKEHSTLLLTVNGNPFSKDAVVGMCAALTKQVGFRCTALMFRHSYAIHSLIKLREQKDFKGDPLMYVRDRLGHTSVTTTFKYMRQIERLSGALILSIQSEFDALFGAPIFAQ